MTDITPEELRHKGFQILLPEDDDLIVKKSFTYPFGRVEGKITICSDLVIIITKPKQKPDVFPGKFHECRVSDTDFTKSTLKHYGLSRNDINNAVDVLKQVMEEKFPQPRNKKQ